jgi:hypothetical protein
LKNIRRAELCINDGFHDLLSPSGGYFHLPPNGYCARNLLIHV